jgi:hypothetical protein
MSFPDENATGGGRLTEREAFLAMSEFLWQYAQRAGDDLITLLGDTKIQPDGGPTDPAAWQDWLECVEHVRSGFPLRRARR